MRVRRGRSPSGNADVVRLEPLAEDEAAALLERALRARVVDEQTGRRALEAAEGNPALPRAVARDPGRARRAARTCRRPSRRCSPPASTAFRPRSGPSVQRASVQGRAFSRRALAELVGERSLATLDVTLGALQRRELIQRDPRAFGGADGLRFSHGLIRDAAYRFLPKETRSELHERLALWLDRGGRGSQLGEQEEVVGYHLEQAYHYRAELGRVGARGARPRRLRPPDGSTRRAGRAFARSDLPAAVNLLERAEALLSRDDRARAELLPSLGAALTEAGRLSEADRVLEAAVDCSRVNDDERLEAHAIVEQLFLRIQVDTEKAITEARELGERLQATFEANRTPMACARCGAFARWWHWLEGKCLDADAAWEQAAEYAREIRRLTESGQTFLAWLASSAFSGPLRSAKGSAAVRRSANRWAKTGGPTAATCIRSPACTR
jgi:hypothetical protein